MNHRRGSQKRTADGAWGHSRRRGRLSIALVVWLAATTFSGPATSMASADGGDVVGGAMELLGDDGGAALFDARDIAPAQPMSNCLAVRLRGATAAHEVRLYGNATGTLAPFLSLTVEVGRGGAFGGCQGFTGALLYQGTLAGFVAAHNSAATGLSTGTTASASSATTYRVTVELLDDPRAQGRDAGASFGWAAMPAADGDVAGPAPVPTAPAGPAGNQGSPGTLAPDQGDAGPRPTLDGQPPGLGTVGPDGGPTEQALSALAGRASSGPAGTPEGTGDEREGILRQIIEVLRTIARGAGGVAADPALPLLLLLLVLLFLTVQHRIDARDPKLALAPLYPDNDLDFHPPASRRAD